MALHLSLLRQWHATGPQRRYSFPLFSLNISGDLWQLTLPSHNLWCNVTLLYFLQNFEKILER